MIAAAVDCPGECIFVEADDGPIASDEADADMKPAEVVGGEPVATAGGDQHGARC